MYPFNPYRLFGKYSLLLFVMTILLLVWPAEASSAHAFPWGKSRSKPPTLEVQLSLRESKTAAYRSTITIRSKPWSQWLKQLEPAAVKEQTIPYEYVELEIMDKASPISARYHWNGSKQLIKTGESENGEQVYRMPEPMLTALQQAVQSLRKAHYGKVVDWKTAEGLLPRGAKFTITDLETGLSFRGQRRAGSSHADVQPLTKEDSAIMKQIYGGRWSWNRRAILVESPEGPLAASMHGMPHGGDGIPGNNFNGHFCIHYPGSITHGSGSSDPAHQVMVQRAGGQLEAYHRTLTPMQIAELFVVSVNQKDPHLLNVLLHQDAKNRDQLLQTWLDDSIRAIRLTDHEVSSSLTTEDKGKEPNHTTLHTRMNVWYAHSGNKTRRFRWSFIREAPEGPWRAEALETE